MSLGQRQQTKNLFILVGQGKVETLWCPCLSALVIPLSFLIISCVGLLEQEESIFSQVLSHVYRLQNKILFGCSWALMLFHTWDLVVCLNGQM
uniref:Uncharacterized protein n=1 Tax=Pyxicephalus adspersus TaxID=30357 RepID=A0AAV3AGI0_PYXAD|nr:TPA: hypothetical protein GDO54_017788 [Pyxicephalus adspersus]